MNYDFVLKIDDDTWCNIDRVLKQITRDVGSAEATWYGHMRCDWPRESGDGKWGDPGYTASNYPCFGGGGGNVLTHDLSDWVGINALDLQDLQGEDVSMGIWIGARVHKRIVNNNFHALGGSACDDEVATAPELDIQDIRAMWARLTLCGHECTRCDKAAEYKEHGPGGR